MNVYKDGNSLYPSNKVESESFQIIRKSMLRFQKSPCLDYLVVNILDHCNLRCKGCDHFACIADPYFVSISQIRHDLQRLGTLLEHDYVTEIAVMGGEPLLHPDLIEILEEVRLQFPFTRIRLTTNGLLLLQQTKSFWEKCKELKVAIVVTRYPIEGLDHRGMELRAEKENVEFQFFEHTGETGRMLFKKVIDLSGRQHPLESFSKCPAANHANFLMEGRIYGCPFSCQAYRIFNKKFNQHLRITKVDYFDIYEKNSKEDLFVFCASPHYFCRYCAGKEGLFSWEKSRQVMNEWI